MHESRINARESSAYYSLPYYRAIFYSTAILCLICYVYKMQMCNLQFTIYNAHIQGTTVHCTADTREMENGNKFAFEYRFLRFFQSSRTRWFTLNKFWFSCTEILCLRKAAQ